MFGLAGRSLEAFLDIPGDEIPQPLHTKWFFEEGIGAG
jgi:hypothetical protein